MIYNFYGENNFLIKNELQSHLQVFQNNDFEIFVCDFDLSKEFAQKENFEDLLLKAKNNIDSIGLFCNKKIIVFKNFSDKVFTKTILKKLFCSLSKIQNNKDIVVFFTSKNKIAFDSKLLIKYKEHKAITPAQTESMIKIISKDNGVVLTKDAVDFLKNTFDGDLEIIELEIQKLSNYKKEINEQAILDLINKPNIAVKFALSNALNTLNKGNCIKTLLNELDAHTFDLLLFGSVVAYIRNAILIKEKQTLKQTGFKIHPFVEKTMGKFINKFSLKELKTLYAQLYQDDLLIKKGRLKASLSLELFISKNL